MPIRVNPACIRPFTIFCLVPLSLQTISAAQPFKWLELGTPPYFLKFVLWSLLNPEDILKGTSTIVL